MEPGGEVDLAAHDVALGATNDPVDGVVGEFRVEPSRAGEDLDGVVVAELGKLGSDQSRARLEELGPQAGVPAAVGLVRAPTSLEYLAELDERVVVRCGEGDEIARARGEDGVARGVVDEDLAGFGALEVRHRGVAPAARQRGRLEGSEDVRGDVRAVTGLGRAGRGRHAARAGREETRSDGRD